MNSLRLVESSSETVGGFVKEKTKAQKRAEDARDYFVKELYQIADEFKLVSDGLDLPCSEFYCASIDQNGKEIADSATLFEGCVVYEPCEDGLDSEWQTFNRIIFGYNGGVYYQPQEYHKSPAHQQKCYPVDGLDIYEIKEIKNAQNHLESISDMALDTIRQARRIAKVGKSAVEQAG